MADSEEDSMVGYCRPPKGSQFKPGLSGNRKGRPKGSHSLFSAIQDELNSSIEINVGGERKKVTQRQAIAKALVHKSMKGDARAADVIIKVEEKHQAKLSPDLPVRFTLSLGESTKPLWLPGNADPDDDPTE